MKKPQYSLRCYCSQSNIKIQDFIATWSVYSWCAECSHMAISEPRWYRIFVHTMGEGVHIIIPTALSDLCMSVCPYQPFGIKTPHTHFLQSLNLCTFKSNPITDLRRPWGFQEVKAPRFQHNRHMKVVRLSALRTGCLYPPGSIPGTRFCQRLSRPQGHSAVRRVMSLKNSNDTIGNRTRDLPTCLNQLRYGMPHCDSNFHMYVCSHRMPEMFREVQDIK